MHNNQISLTAITKRLFRIFYLSLFLSSFGLIAMAVFFMHPLLFSLGGLSGLCCLAIRSIALTHDCHSIAGLMPEPPVQKTPADTALEELKELLAHSLHPDLSWQERSNLRQSIERVLRHYPELFALYSGEIKTIHPVLAGRITLMQKQQALQS